MAINKKITEEYRSKLWHPKYLESKSFYIEKVRKEAKLYEQMIAEKRKYKIISYILLGIICFSLIVIYV